ncbi:hypothetical protein NQ314_000430 [Rhamnusium bicolor]|uniref:Uncharacterized protein n=1 Tax=Rhamnusium bicolor TaxID=1586634 RepID=A0AAV8ZWS7_9CUCU|nr:hypothetical protein NQ314_000430 [Rhamnusium bicolor]
MLSSHDTEMVSVLDSMGAYDLYPPSFAATIIWELRRNSNDEMNYVNVLYKKSSSELVNLVVNGCEFNCQLENFKTVLKPVTVDSQVWKEECLITTN